MYRSCTGIWFTITMLQYYIWLGLVLTVILVLGLGLGLGIILHFVIGTWSNGRNYRWANLSLRKNVLPRNFYGSSMVKWSNTLRTLWCFHTLQKILILAHNDDSVYKWYSIHILTLYKPCWPFIKQLSKLRTHTLHWPHWAHKQEKPLIKVTLEEQHLNGGRIWKAGISVYSSLRCGGDLYMCGL